LSLSNFDENQGQDDQSKNEKNGFVHLGSRMKKKEKKKKIIKNGREQPKKNLRAFFSLFEDTLYTP
jgi:hypothetical protein